MNEQHHPTPRRNAFVPASGTKFGPDELLAALAQMGINATTHSHHAVFTVEESQHLAADIAGAHTKNLFLKDKKGRIFLVSAAKEARINLKKLHEVIGASGRLSFGTEAQLWQYLGVRPGCVSALAVINDIEGAVTMVLDANLMHADIINFHPLVNTMTTSLTREGLRAFFEATCHMPLVVDLPVPPELQTG